MDRVKTGIPGLDELIQGGIPKGSSCLIAGGAGTGKTIFATQFLYKGALDYKEPGLLVTLETNLKNIVWNMESFNWNIRSLQEKNLLRIYRLNLEQDSQDDNVEDRIDDELDVIAETVEEIGATRIVVDTVTAFGIWITQKAKLRGILYDFTNKLKDMDVTTVLTTETSGKKEAFSGMGVEEFIVDGVIALYFNPPTRALFVKKMRGTNQSKFIHTFDITNNGIAVNTKDHVQWDAMK
ncbi:MAG: ATPase domain-containing protein [Candidatus Diapherotrites archaeon]|nr:ATPase domain-containing protein [Candidatus Diapherotrites archaeon]